MNTDKKKVLIIGGGFGGISCALHLEKYAGENLEVTLVSDKRHFDYHGALYRLVTGRSPMETCIPLDSIFEGKKINVFQDFINSLNIEEKYALGQDDIKYHFDYLVLGTGAQAEYFNIPGVAENAFVLKSVADAVKLRKHLETALATCKDSKKEDQSCYAHIVVIGAGATGVELAGELGVYARNLAKKHSFDPEAVKIDLIERSNRVLSMFPQAVSEKVEKRLQDLGVNILLNKTVEKEDLENVYLKDMSLNTRTVIWTAGARATETPQKFGFEVNNKGQVSVDDLLQIRGFEDVFAVGDVADTEYSWMAQTAMFDGSFVAETIISKLKGRELLRYEPPAPSYAIPVGPGWAVYISPDATYYGKVGWWLRRLLDFKVMRAFLPLHTAIEVIKYGGIMDDSL